MSGRETHVGSTGSVVSSITEVGTDSACTVVGTSAITSWLRLFVFIH
jgi:hypothetical protein